MIIRLVRILQNYFLKHSYIVKFHISIYSRLFINYWHMNFNFRYMKQLPSLYTRQWRFNFNKTNMLHTSFLLARLNVFQPCKLTCQNYVLFIISLYISLKTWLIFQSFSDVICLVFLKFNYMYIDKCRMRFTCNVFKLHKLKSFLLIHLWKLVFWTQH